MTAPQKYAEAHRVLQALAAEHTHLSQKVANKEMCPIDALVKSDALIKEMQHTAKEMDALRSAMTADENVEAYVLIHS